MINSLAHDVKAHCNLMIEEAADKQDELISQQRDYARRGDFDREQFLDFEIEYQQGRKDALRVILLVVADHEPNL